LLLFSSSLDVAFLFVLLVILLFTFIIIHLFTLIIVCFFMFVGVTLFALNVISLSMLGVDLFRVCCRPSSHSLLGTRSFNVSLHIYCYFSPSHSYPCVVIYHWKLYYPPPFFLASWELLEVNNLTNCFSINIFVFGL
jgi:hypothetical protein